MQTCPTPETVAFHFSPFFLQANIPLCLSFEFHWKIGVTQTQLLSIPVPIFTVCSWMVHTFTTLSLSFCFLGLHPRHREGPRLGVKLELQPPAYTTATAMQDPSHVCDLHHSSWQCRIPDPLSEPRDKSCILMDTSRIHFHCTTQELWLLLHLILWLWFLLTLTLSLFILLRTLVLIDSDFISLHSATKILPVNCHLFVHSFNIYWAFTMCQAVF